MDAETESYILLLLSDGNLPTGSFVASSGLESYEKHGFFSLASSQRPSPASPNDNDTPPPPLKIAALTAFIRDSVQTYASSTLPYIAAIYSIADDLLSSSKYSLKDGLRMVLKYDNLYEATTLNHVARRASTAQGVALLTLLMRGLVRPAWAEGGEGGKRVLEELADTLKLEIRKGNASGHLPICWSVLTASLGLSLPRSQHLFLFLHARSLLSASVRLNAIGPYAAQQLLLHVVRPLVGAALRESGSSRIRLSTKSTERVLSIKSTERGGRVGEEGGNTGMEGEDHDEEGEGDLELELDDTIEDGPAVTWPMGEILAARHDLQHSRIFNS